jgi:hypothetical protein
MRALEKRVLKLEREAAAAAVYFVWLDASSETEEEALARQLPDGAPDNVVVTVFKWADPQTVTQVTCESSDDLCLLAPAGRA